jgi:phenylpropionate dioxygenase-like ring-hydroxylating dioxygenase large terminal subunit
MLTFPSAWYVVCLGADLPPGGSVRVDMLSTSMTARRASRGEVQVVDDRTGLALPAREVNEMVMAWYGPGEPRFEIAPIPELSMPGWRRLRWRKPRPFATTVENVMRDVVDNDHFGPVHGLLGARTDAEQNGPFLDTLSEGIIDTSRFAGPKLLAHLRIEGRLHGMGLLVYHMTVTMGLRLRYVTVSTATPIDEGHVRMHLALCMQRAPLGPFSGLVEPLVLDNFAHNFENDRGHWESASGRFEPEARLTRERPLLGIFDRWAAGFTNARSAA